ncbi:hypothetical protein DSL64_03875 [Dyadobacter luteus]|uniref:Yip1 domain-containing protein n=1 Tax=Dyadobacter luteus TaxID=2259619 RepID=A0A3D8YG16_9BACT|nr:hypothetical protein DSL64_03875 [Dyadobacter luteus]
MDIHLDKKTLFLMLIVSVVTTIFLTKYFLISENLYFKSLSDQFSYNQIASIIESERKWIWVPYLIMPLILLVKLLFVSVCLSLGVYFYCDRFDFERVFSLVMKAEFIFFIPSVIKILWFHFVNIDYSIKDIHFFYPLSAIHIFDPVLLENWLIYPLQVLNIFEILYWIILAYGIRKIVNMNLSKSLEIVLTSYGSGLVLWIVSVMFLSITYGHK